MPLLTVYSEFIPNASVSDQNRLLFGSFWGRDTAIKEFLAKLQLGSAEDGMTSFNVDGVQIHLSSIKDYAKRTGRLNSPVFGAISQLWIYDRCVVKNGTDARLAYLLVEPNTAKQSKENDELIWEKITQLSDVPLLSDWSDVLLDYAYSQQWLLHIEGNQLDAIKIELPEDLKMLCQTWLRAIP